MYKNTALVWNDALLLLQGLGMTLFIFVVSFAAGTLIGFLLAVIRERRVPVLAMIPPTVSLAVGQLQVSSLVSIIGVVDLTKIGTGLNLRTLAPFKIWPIVALGYFIVSKPLSMLADWSERRLKGHVDPRTVA